MVPPDGTSDSESSLEDSDLSSGDLVDVLSMVPNDGKIGKKFRPGQFKCPLVYQHTFSLHWRLKQNQALNGVATSSVLDKFSISNRKHMFVYARRNEIVYIKLSEEVTSSSYYDFESNEQSRPVSTTSINHSKTLSTSEASQINNANNNHNNNINNINNVSDANNPNNATNVTNATNATNATNNATNNAINVNNAANANNATSANDVNSANNAGNLEESKKSPSNKSGGSPKNSPSSRKVGPNQTRGIEMRKLVVEVYGLETPGKEITEELMNMLEAKSITNITLKVMSSHLARNPHNLNLTKAVRFVNLLLFIKYAIIDLNRN